MNTCFNRKLICKIFFLKNDIIPHLLEKFGLSSGSDYSSKSSCMKEIEKVFFASNSSSIQSKRKAPPNLAYETIGTRFYYVSNTDLTTPDINAWGEKWRSFFALPPSKERMGLCPKC